MRLLTIIIGLIVTSASFGADALDEVNAARARKGLPPFQRDATLSAGAENCAQYRAARLIEGHVRGGMGDFQFLPQSLWMGTTGGCRGTGSELGIPNVRDVQPGPIRRRCCGDGS